MQVAQYQSARLLIGIATATGAELSRCLPSPICNFNKILNAFS